RRHYLRRGHSPWLQPACGAAEMPRHQAPPAQGQRSSRPASSGVVLLKEAQNLRSRHITGDEGLADAAGENEGERTAADLLVLRDEGKQGLRIRQTARNVGHAPWQADSLQMRLDA